MNKIEVGASKFRNKRIKEILSKKNKEKLEESIIDLWFWHYGNST